MKYCQGTNCHTYDTKDRKKGSKDNKRNETRKRTNFYYGGGNFCSLNCQTDWFNTHGDNAINYFGRVESPIVLVEANAWQQIYNRECRDNSYNLIEGVPQTIDYNIITKATRPTSEGN
jgi:hypothetical protein